MSLDSDTIETDADADADAVFSALVSVGDIRLHTDCAGSGDVTILFEAGLGGSAFEFLPIQRALASRARVCLYDRGGYGRSDPAPRPRHARRLAAEADELLTQLGIDGPLILVGHSFGGFIMRLLADRRESDVRGLVLIDASHEQQLEELEKVRGGSMMPSGRHFVLSPPEIPAALSPEVRELIQRHSRQRKSFASLHAEIASFRTSADQVRKARRTVDYPVWVLRRGQDLYVGQREGERKTAIWQTLQEDLAQISTRGRVVVARNSGHHVHADEPQVVIEALTTLLDLHAIPGQADAAADRSEPPVDARAAPEADVQAVSGMSSRAEPPLTGSRTQLGEELRPTIQTGLDADSRSIDTTIDEQASDAGLPAAPGTVSR